VTVVSFYHSSLSIDISRVLVVSCGLEDYLDRMACFSVCVRGVQKSSKPTRRYANQTYIFTYTQFPWEQLRMLRAYAEKGDKVHDRVSTSSTDSHQLHASAHSVRG
jgi:hypothetical protein